MKMKCLLFVLVLFISNGLIGQSLNEYKYVIIPSKYDFQKSEDQYQVNSLTKFLFEKEGFETVYANIELPADIANNPCSALTANVNNESNMFTTKLVIELVNCKNQKVLVTEEGKSKEKDYKKGYQEALREAFEYVTAQNYNYSATENIAVNTALENAKKSIEEATDAIQEEIEEEENKVEEIEEEVEEIEETVIEPSENYDPKKNQMDRVDNGNILDVSTEKKLYAQENSLGFQLVDSSPKVVFILLKSSKDDLYLLKNRSGIFFKENDKWFAEYYFDGKYIKQEFEVKW